jgi:hypothetical protein
MTTGRINQVTTLQPLSPREGEIGRPTPSSIQKRESKAKSFEVKGWRHTSAFYSRHDSLLLPKSFSTPSGSKLIRSVKQHQDQAQHPIASL